MPEPSWTAVLAWNLAGCLAAFTVVWAASLRLKDASIVDRVWGLGFVGVVWATAWQVGLSPRGWLLCALVTLWGLRLSAYITWRNWGEGEDRRYQAMRHNHGSRFWWVSLGTVFGFQGLLVWAIGLPLQLGQGGELGWLDAAGASLWAVGFAFESIGDYQLTRFKADPANQGRVMDRGLWRYTRHPNYFGDALVWWGFYLVAASSPSGAVWTLPAPLVMTWLLLRVSGVKLLEADMHERRPAYRDYKRRTSAFFPLPPKAQTS